LILQITMSKGDGVRTVVVGGKQGVQQHYCGTVGGQSTDFSTIDTEIKVSFFLFFPKSSIAQDETASPRSSKTTPWRHRTCTLQTTPTTKGS
jgi:hypothetical protein